MKGPIKVAISTMLFILAAIAALLVTHSCYTLVVTYGGVCFSYQCTPSAFSLIPLVLVSAVLVALNGLLMIKSAIAIVGEFKK